MKKRISILIIAILTIVPFAKTANQSNQSLLLSIADNKMHSMYPYDNYLSPVPILAFNNVSEYSGNSQNNIMLLAAQPYKMYIKQTGKKIARTIELKTYSKWGIFALVFLMWFCQSLALIKED